MPLPAAVYMMQVVDVIDHYRYALTHYLTLTLNEPYLQISSLGTPYQKWAFFVNKDFELLALSVHNLLRYTSRLVHETQCPKGNASVEYLASFKRKSNRVESGSTITKLNRDSDSERGPGNRRGVGGHPRPLAAGDRTRGWLA